jgi:hypothetical protein
MQVLHLEVQVHIDVVIFNRRKVEVFQTQEFTGGLLRTGYRVQSGRTLLHVAVYIYGGQEGNESVIWVVLGRRV